MPDTESPVASHPLPCPARVALTDRIIVRVSGPGTDKFLQGQFSQQIDDVTPTQAPSAAACSPKGRAYCLTRLVRDGDDVLMALPADLADDTITHLRKYLMLFRGTSMQIEAGASMIGLLGQSAAEPIHSGITGQLWAAGDSTAIVGGHLVRTMDTAEGLARFELWQTATLASSVQQALDALPQATLADWQASEIAAGVASLTMATRDSFVPQMLNWQHLGGIHFKKGCYTGQEVIARMHFLGQLKKSLFRFSCDRADTSPAPGEAIMNGERPVGDVVNAVRLGDGTVELLAVVRHDAVGHPLAPATMPAATLSVCSLPYAVPEREHIDTPDT